MTRVRASVQINAPKDLVWRIISDFRRWPEWGPTVTAVRSEADSVRQGATGSVRTPLGFWLPFVITRVEEGHSWSWKVAGMEATGHELSGGPDRCRLEFSAPWYLFPYLIVLKAGLRRVKAIAQPPRK